MTFESRKFDEIEEAVSDQFIFWAQGLRDAISQIKDGRERALANTKLEESVMWANKALNVNGLKDASEVER